MRLAILVVAAMVAASAPAGSQTPLRPVVVDTPSRPDGVSPVPHRIVPEGSDCPAPEPVSAASPDTSVFDESDTGQPPELLKAGKRRYPSDLERRGIGGRVEFSLVIDTLGSPEPCSVRVLYATNTSFELAAFWVIMGSRYRPGRINGRPVRTRVLQSVTFRP